MNATTYSNPVSASNAIVIIDPQKAIADARNRRSIVVTLRENNVLREGVDFGIVPGSTKPTLLKPGSERLCAAFGLDPRFETLDKVERWDGDNPMFFYRVICHLIHIDSGLELATGIGSCNSMESKYRWRWVNESDVPPELDKTKLTHKQGAISEFTFAVDKAETTGAYGKPAAYWQAFKDAIASGQARKITRKTSKGKDMDAWEIGGLTYRIPNDDIFSLVNTIDKMACKRALIAATLIGANASEFFTQDIEDMPGFGITEDVIVQGSATPVTREVNENTGEISQPSRPATVSGAGVPKSAASSDEGELASFWDEDATAWNSFLNSCKEKLSITAKSVTDALGKFDALKIANWHASKGWALAAVLAYAKDFDSIGISNGAMFITQDAAQSDKLNDMAQQIATAIKQAEPEKAG